MYTEHVMSISQNLRSIEESVNGIADSALNQLEAVEFHFKKLADKELPYEWYNVEFESRDQVIKQIRLNLNNLRYCLTDVCEKL